MSGFGRTGKMFGIDHHDTTPDIMVLAKGLTSAYIPFGAMMVSDKIAKHFDNIPMVLGLTCSAHPVACAAALENISVIQEGKLLENASEMGKYMELEVTKLMQKHPSIGDFRNTGLLGCIELVKGFFLELNWSLIVKQKNLLRLGTLHMMKWNQHCEWLQK